MTFELYTSPTATISERNIKLPNFTKSKSLIDSSKYIASGALKSAVNVALALGQPLLLTGEPGTGKTQLAANIAYQLEIDCYKFHTKSTSTARDLFYRYDALRHFHDAQVKKQLTIDTADYIQLEALGKAIVESKDKRAVVLIDEIDKAPRDFPNDVLNELDNMTFAIQETGQEYEAHLANRPIVIITSNSEKNLPDAFLRRCIFYHIPFPDKKLLTQIVNNRLALSPQFSDKMITAAIDHFLTIRSSGLRKKPATAELLAWIHILDQLEIDLTQDFPLQIQRLKQTYAILVKNQEDFAKVMKEF